MQITPELEINDAELVFKASRSGGPGGQHVNTSSTRVELWWDLESSESLTEEQRDRLRSRLAKRLDRSGRLRLVSGGSRSQLANRRNVSERFAALLAQAIEVPRPRKKTRPGKAVRQRRREDKERQSARKALRRRPPED